MVDSSRIMKYILFIFCLIIIAYFFAPLIYENIRPRYYGFSVVQIGENQAKIGEIIHLTESDLLTSPDLVSALQQNSSRSIGLSKEEYSYYSSEYHNYSQNFTGQRSYYEYSGKIFYLEFIQDDVHHL